jgi:hypothetical protein
VSDVSSKASETAREVAQSRPLEILARVGLVAYGVVHLLIGVIALRIAWGDDRDEADQAGALESLADQPFGPPLLWLLAIGLLALAFWHGSRAIWSFRTGDTATRARRRMMAGGAAALSVLLAGGAATFALGARASAAEAQESTTQGVLALPFGQILVVAVALIIIAIGISQVGKAARRQFAHEIDPGSMSPATRRTLTGLGVIGYGAKGIALTVVGLLLGYAAVTFDASKARGLDGAMRTIVIQPFGQLLLTGVALGFMAFAVFAFAQSRYRPM